jgi:hypothetical protein
MPFDFMPFVEPLLNLLLAAVSAAVLTVVPPAIKWILQKAKLDGLLSDDVVRGYLEKALLNGIALARAEVSKQKLTADIDNAVVVFVLGYLRQNVPDALKHFGLTEAKVAELVKARLATVVPTV